MADNWLKQYHRMFPDPYNPVEPTSCDITSYHDYVVMNAHEVVFDPTPEDSERILREALLKRNG